MQRPWGYETFCGVTDDSGSVHNFCFSTPIVPRAAEIRTMAVSLISRMLADRAIETQTTQDLTNERSALIAEVVALRQEKTRLANEIEALGRR